MAPCSFGGCKVAPLPASPGIRWSLRRPVSVQALLMAACFTVLCGLAFTLPYLALLLIAIVWCTRRRNGGLYNPGSVLAADKAANWKMYDACGATRLRAASLVHVWRGPDWLVLRLQGLSSNGQARREDVTIWRKSVGTQGWRQLHERTARLAARAAIAGGAP